MDSDLMKNTGVDPWDVRSPKSAWQLLDVLYECRDWSLAIGNWMNDKWTPVLAMRWNGDENSKGNPISRGYPTWFVIPTEQNELYLNSTFIPENKKDFVRHFLSQS